MLDKLKRLFQGTPKTKPAYEDIYGEVKKCYRTKHCNGGWVVEKYSSALFDYEWMPTDQKR
jgi:hypothetical protein